MPLYIVALGTIHEAVNPGWCRRCCSFFSASLCFGMCCTKLKLDCNTHVYIFFIARGVGRWAGRGNWQLNYDTGLFARLYLRTFIATLPSPSHSAQHKGRDAMRLTANVTAHLCKYFVTLSLADIYHIVGYIYIAYI